MKTDNAGTRIKELRKRLGISREDFIKIFPVKIRTLQAWELNISPPKDIVAKLLIERLEEMANKKSYKFEMLKGLNPKILFTAKQAVDIAKATIEYQLAWYKQNNIQKFNEYTPEILEETLKRLDISNIKKLDKNLNIQELIEKEVAFINIEQIEMFIKKSSIFIY